MKTNPRGIQALLNHVGEGNVAVQFLNQCTTDVVQRRDHTKVTFATEKGNVDPADLLPGAKPRKVGMIVWMDADKVEEWRKTL